MGQSLGIPGQPMGGMGPVQEAMAVNSPTPQMLNMARGQDPTANGFGDISSHMPGKPQGMPPAPKMQAGGPGFPSSLDAGTPSGGPDQMKMLLAKLLSRGGRA
jgi:hypothetical protein